MRRQEEETRALVRAGHRPVPPRPLDVADVADAGGGDAVS